MSNQRTTIWADVTGTTRLTLPVTDTSGAMSTLQTAMLAVTCGIVFSYADGTLTLTGDTPSAGTFQSVKDAAVLSFLCNDGTIVSLTLPSPTEGIFFADTDTVDSSTIGGIIAAAVGHLLSSTGSPAASFIGGVRF